ncbi:MAG: LysM peptidoglycan-binding domain-containing protein [Peptococcaceae bacterium]|nr:LysM peptidoglycan-binding domain-containing protein [Peptococcaceae bacterium]
MISNKSDALLKVYIDIANRDLLLYEDDQLVRRYPIQSIKADLPSGRFSILEKIYNPAIELGSRWIGFNKQPLGIHGIASCPEHQVNLGIRMENTNLIELYAMVPNGTIVEITRTPLDLSPPAVPNQFGRFPATPSAFPIVAGPHCYIVQRGDTIWKLSTRFKIPMESILAANLLPNPNRLQQGQVINLPLLWPQK